ncbi:MAG TPA: hypothetical protein VF703_07395 [Pyrinomonadaceae bacterium]|jgi:hypothetical protein
MSPEELFNPDDEKAFVDSTTVHLNKGAAMKRGISPEAYVSLAREQWRSCSTDQVYAIKLLIDPLVSKAASDFPPEWAASGRPFCVLVARIDPDGNLIDAPPDYVLPSYPGVYLSHLVFGSPSGEQTPDPAEPAEYLFAFLDVLGFEELLKSIGLDELSRRYEELLAVALAPQSETRPWSLAQTLVRGDPVPALMWLPMQTAYFSDSLLLWVHYHPGHVEEFLNRCSKVFCQALGLGLPIRGAIAVGRARLDKKNGIYLGSPLIEAVRLEGKSDWVGIALSASWKSEAPPFPVPPDCVFVYQPPLKEVAESLFSGLVLDWPRAWRESRQDSAVEYLTRLRDPRLPEHLQARYDAAIRFYEYSEANQDWCVPEGWTRIRPTDLR